MSLRILVYDFFDAEDLTIHEKEGHDQSKYNHDNADPVKIFVR